MKNHKQGCIELLKERGVELNDIAVIVYDLQKAYHPDLTMEEILLSIEAVLDKREVQHAVMSGIAFDKAAEERIFDSDILEDILNSDEALYGVDEVLAYGICNLYGSIALTNYGYVDKLKPGIIKKLNSHNEKCHTFLDDIVGAIAASAAARIAHNE